MTAVEIPETLAPFTWASSTAAANAERAGCAGVEPPPGWRQVRAWNGAVQPWPDAGHSNPWVWLVGLHGGAGVSTLVHAMPRLAGDARRQLPAGGGGQSPFVVVVARNHSDGLVHAQDFARQAITGLIPASISVLGLVLVADAPVRPDSAVRQFTKVVSRAYPRAWQIPWITEWRSARPDPTAGPLPAPVTRLAQDLAQLTGCATSSQR